MYTQAQIVIQSIPAEFEKALNRAMADLIDDGCAIVSVTVQDCGRETYDFVGTILYKTDARSLY